MLCDIWKDTILIKLTPLSDYLDLGIIRPRHYRALVAVMNGYHMGMGVFQDIDRELVKAATELGGNDQLRDQIVYGIARILPLTFFLFAVYLYTRGKTKLQKERNKNVVLLASAAVLIAIGVGWLVGEVFDRERPFVTFPHFHHVDIGVPPNLNSFPSGHALMLFAFAGVFYYIGHHPNWARFLLLIAVIVVVARVVAGVHYPSDVLAGAVLGLIVAKIVSWQSQWLDEQMK